MSVERTERDTIAEIILRGWGLPEQLPEDDGRLSMARTAADALLGVFDITPRKKEEDAK